MKVSVFGSSQPRPGEAPYRDAFRLGQALAERGHVVLTGGYIGTMEAVSRGAAEAGGHVIGVTCAEIERWRQIGANPWVTEEWKRETLVERLQALILACDAAVALPGGPGTLTEIALTWNLMIIAVIPRRPLILVGSGWQTILDQAYRTFHAYFPQAQRDLLHFAPDVRAAVNLLAGTE